MSSYTKPRRTFDEQIDLLRSRGMTIGDRDLARHYLATVGYYAMGSYWYPARKEVEVDGVLTLSDEFVAGATFEHAVSLYLFDQKLRLIALEALERIERALKVQVAYILGASDRFAHRKPEFMRPKFVSASQHRNSHAGWLDEVDKKVDRPTHRAIKAVRDRYDGDLPIWIAIETMDFGDISRLLGGLAAEWSEPVAKALGMETVPTLTSWARSMNHLRNLCAHHQRLWNRELTDQPRAARGPLRDYFLQLDGHQELWHRSYAALLVLTYLHEQVVPVSSWPQRLGQLLAALPVSPGVTHAEMGAPSDWHLHPSWGLTK